MGARNNMQLFWLLVIFGPLVVARRGYSPRLRQLKKQNPPPLVESRVAMVDTDIPAHIISENFISVTLDPFMIRDLPWADP